MSAQACCEAAKRYWVRTSSMNSPSAKSLFVRLFTMELERLTPSERMVIRVFSYFCLLFVPLVVLFVVARTYRDTCTYSPDDLRNRVVGARVMLVGHDPYTFFWQPGMPEELLDPVHEPKAHRLTVSPPTLLIYAVVAPLCLFRRSGSCPSCSNGWR